MPSLQVREMPERVYRRLASEAKRQHRSLAQQAIVSLEVGLELQPDPVARRRRVLQEVMDDPALGNSAQLPTPAQLIREDRDR